MAKNFARMLYQRRLAILRSSQETEKEVLSAFISFRKELLKKLETLNDRNMKRVLDSVDKNIDELKSTFVNVMDKAAKETFLKSAEQTVEAIREAGLKVSFLQAPQRAIREAIVRQPLVRSIDKLGDRASRIIQKTTVDALVRGDSVPDTAKILAEKLNIERARAVTIVRTNLNAAANEGHLAAYEANPEYVPKKRWDAVFDDRTSAICAELNGQEVGMNEKFFSAVLQESFDAPPAHPNCRSQVIPVFNIPELNEIVQDESKRVKDYNTGDYKIVDSTVNYYDWLRDQPADIQHRVLGSWEKVEQFAK